METAAQNVTLEDEVNGAYTVRYTVPADCVDDILAISVRIAVRSDTYACGSFVR